MRRSISFKKAPSRPARSIPPPPAVPWAPPTIISEIHSPVRLDLRSQLNWQRGMYVKSNPSLNHGKLDTLIWLMVTSRDVFSERGGAWQVSPYSGCSRCAIRGRAIRLSYLTSMGIIPPHMGSRLGLRINHISACFLLPNIPAMSISFSIMAEKSGKVFFFQSSNFSGKPGWAGKINSQLVVTAIASKVPVPVRRLLQDNIQLRQTYWYGNQLRPKTPASNTHAAKNTMPPQIQPIYV